MVRKMGMENFFQVSNEAVEEIKREIGEDEARLRHIEELIRQWIICEDYLPKDYDKDQARNFIRSAKFNLEIAKRKFEGYFLAKQAFPQFYQNRNPEDEAILRVFDNINIAIGPKLTEKGERIIFFSLANTDPDAFDMETAMKLFWMIYDLSLTCQIPMISEILIFDCGNSCSSHIAKFLSTSFKNSISLIRDAYAARVSQIHLLNCPVMVEKLLTTLRPLLHEKVKQRFTVHKGIETLLKHLSPKVLPSDFGGNLDSCRDYTQQWREMLVENSDWFKSQEAVKVVGTPPKKILKFSYDSQLEGSFRQLNID